MTIAYLGLGSSLGDRIGNLRQAITRLNSQEQSDTKVTKVSSVYESAHLGLNPGDELRYPAHLNAVVEITTLLDPFGLLARLQQIEDAGKRERAQRWAPRTIDIDILLFDEVVMDTPALKLPHPEMTNRAFVLVPLNEVSPRLRLPDNRTVQELMSSSQIRSQRIEQVASCHELLL